MAYSPNLLKLKNWMCFKSLEKKQPMNPHNGFAGSVTNTEHWATYSNAKKAVKKYNFGGVSFVFQRHKKIVGIDIDDCIFNGVISDNAQKIIDYFGSYTTISASGAGLHIYIYGEIPKQLICNNPLDGIGAIEVYGWSKAFAETGTQVTNTGLIVRSDNGKLSAFYKRLGYKPQQVVKKPDIANFNDTGNNAIDWACKEMVSISEGGRNAKLNSLAYFLGQLCGGGQINQSDAEQLKIVALNVGLEQLEIDATFDSGFQSGLINPKYPRPQQKKKQYGRTRKSVPLYMLKGGIPEPKKVKTISESGETVIIPMIDFSNHPATNSRMEAYKSNQKRPLWCWLKKDTPCGKCDPYGASKTIEDKKITCVNCGECKKRE